MLGTVGFNLFYKLSWQIMDGCKHLARGSSSNIKISKKNNVLDSFIIDEQFFFVISMRYLHDKLKLYSLNLPDT